MFLDLPESGIQSISFTVAGWVSTAAEFPDVSLLINGRVIPHRLYPRPDVRLAFGDAASHAMGVIAVPDLLALGGPENIDIELLCGEEQAIRAVPVAPSVLGRLSEEHARREAARAWCFAHLQCPHCGMGARGIHVELVRIECRQCRQFFIQLTRAINMISPELRLSSHVTPSDNVSSNPYDPAALSLIEQVTETGGWVLDCGAGARASRLDRVINVEIADYFSTDVLAVGEALPFQANSFDAAVSLAVLEHVRDPLQCARELVRVVKPGGRIMASVPFLQPVHGYPSHYYNMTQQGLINLFDGIAAVESCSVPLHGHPIFAVQWIAKAYLNGLPEDTRADFASTTIGELAGLDPAAFLPLPAATQLSLDAQRTIACLNTVTLTKH